MKPQARIQALIDLLDRIQNSRIPMDSTCGDYFRTRRFIGSKDRAYLAETIYNIMRSHARLGWLLDQSKIEDTPRNRILLFLRAFDGTDVKRIKDLCDGSKYAPETLSEDELEYLAKDFDLSNMPIEIACECPALYQEKLQNYFGEDFEAEMSAMLEPATLDLRVNLFKSTRTKAKNYLEADGVKTLETPYSPWGLRCDNKAYLSRTKAFAKGWISIQDEGSQLIAAMCDAQPGSQVLDYCAGAGGKTLALASAMNCKGRIVAMDLDAKRLSRGRERYKKAGVADMIEVRPLEDEKNKKWLKRQKGKFDLVILDVPCSGTGTWRRNPDMRWTTYGPSLEELTDIQSEILEKTAPLVKEGGKLVYATCSLLPDENENQVEKFLKDNPEFEIKPIDPDLGIGSPYMRLTPHRTNTDGFFTAVIVRR